MTVSLSDLKVLIVDDNKFMINLVKRILDKLDITSPLEANDGAIALERLENAALSLPAPRTDHDISRWLSNLYRGYAG